MSDETLKRVLRAKHDLAKGRGAFFGAMAFNVQTVIDPKIGTAGTNGKWIKFAPDFVAGLSDDELKGVICHEMSHIVYSHINRFKMAGNLNMDIANRAMDYVVNFGIVEASGDFGKLPKNTYYNPKYNYDWSWEQVYTDLMSDPEVQKEIAAGAGAGNGTLDDHSAFGSEEALGEEEARSMATSAYKSVSSSNARVPDPIRDWITTAPTVVQNWRRILRKLITDMITVDRSYANPNRRSGSFSNFILPGSVKDKRYKIAIAVDTSGSISQEMVSLFLGEIRNIAAIAKNLDVDIWSFNDEVVGYEQFSNRTLKGLVSYVPKGCGGTNFDTNYDFMKQQKIKPDVFIMFTDGEPYGSWGDERYTKSVFAINSNRENKPVPPFGTAIYVQ